MEKFSIYNPLTDPTSIVSAVIAELSENPELLTCLQSITGFNGGITGPTGSGGGGGGSLNPTISQNVYVAQLGNDVTGNGTLGNPYATISHAITTITDASSSKYYTINISNGIYNEGSITIIPYIWIKGEEASNTILQNTNLYLSVDFSIGDPQMIGIENITFSGFAPGIFFNNMNNTTVYLSNIISQAMDILIINNINTTIYVDNIKIYNYGGVGNLFFDCTAYISNSYITYFIVGSSIINTDVNIYNSFLNRVNFTDNGNTNNVNITLYGSQITNQMVLQNNNYLFISCDSDCILTDNIINSGMTPGVITNLSNCKYMNYIPSGDATWPTNPGIVSTALDLLASKQFMYSQMNTEGTTTSNTYVALTPDVSVNISPKFSGNIFFNAVIGGLSGNVIDTQIECRIYNVSSSIEISKQIYTVTANTYNHIGMINIIGYETGLTINNTYTYQIQILTTSGSDIKYAMDGAYSSLMANEI